METAAVRVVQFRVRSDYHVPSWYGSASPEDVGLALTVGAQCLACQADQRVATLEAECGKRVEQERRALAAARQDHQHATREMQAEHRRAMEAARQAAAARTQELEGRIREMDAERKRAVEAERQTAMVRAQQLEGRIREMDAERTRAVAAERQAAATRAGDLQHRIRALEEEQKRVHDAARAMGRDLALEVVRAEREQAQAAREADQRRAGEVQSHLQALLFEVTKERDRAREDAERWRERSEALTSRSMAGIGADGEACFRAIIENAVAGPQHWSITDTSSRPGLSDFLLDDRHGFRCMVEVKNKAQLHSLDDLAKFDRDVRNNTQLNYCTAALFLSLRTDTVPRHGAIDVQVVNGRPVVWLASGTPAEIVSTLLLLRALASQCGAAQDRANDGRAERVAAEAHLVPIMDGLRQQLKTLGAQESLVQQLTRALADQRKHLQPLLQNAEALFRAFPGLRDPSKERFAEAVRAVSNAIEARGGGDLAFSTLSKHDKALVRGSGESFDTVLHAVKRQRTAAPSTRPCTPPGPPPPAPGEAGSST
ncbi:MAG: hypothetical protein AAFS07_19075 [Pseudomonadota bacterium]